MTAPMRLNDTGTATAERNIAITAALAELHRAGNIPDTLRLCRYGRSVLLGQSQVLQEAVDLDECRRRNVEVARRVTGGGAVYMSSGVLVWEVVASRQRFGATLGDVAGSVCSGVAAGLARLGVEVRFRTPGDVTVGGRKIGGSSGFADARTVVQQGTVLVEFDVAEMAAVLRLPPDSALSSPRVTSLSECLGHVPPMHEVKAALLAGLSQHWGCTFTPAEMTPAESRLVTRLLGAHSLLEGENRRERGAFEPGRGEVLVSESRAS
jgi:lipoate---protein ligase